MWRKRRCFGGNLKKLAVCASLLFLLLLYIRSPRNNKQSSSDFGVKGGYWVTRRPGETWLEALPLDCDAVINGSTPDAVAAARKWSLDPASVLRDILESHNRCSLYRDAFEFRANAASANEAANPIAYGILIYKDFVQFIFMFSAFYHPQNEYCIALPSNSEDYFKLLVEELPRCFSNVHVLKVGQVEYGSHEIISAVHSCMKMLNGLEGNWTYFQYLSGVDLPLRTNLEMIRIFKQLNNSVNAEVITLPNHRLGYKRILGTSPLPLFKSSLSSLLPRAAVNVIVKDKVALAQLEFLKGTDIPDESFWATVAGNPQALPMPGGWNASGLLEAILERASRHGNVASASELLNKKCKRVPCILSYYISRYQQWTSSACFGKMAQLSCVFGIGDVPILLAQPHLVAHKFYIDFEPAAFFCMIKELKRRTIVPNRDFNYGQYSELPEVELARGMQIERITHPEWLRMM